MSRAPVSETLLGIAAFFAPEQIPLDIFSKEFLSDIEKSEAVAALSEVSLIYPTTSPSGLPLFDVHRLVQECIRQHLGDRSRIFAGLAVKILAFADAFNLDDINTDKASRLEVHVQAVLPHAPDDGEQSEHTLRLLADYGVYLKEKGANPILAPGGPSVEKRKLRFE